MNRRYNTGLNPRSGRGNSWIAPSIKFVRLNPDSPPARGEVLFPIGREKREDVSGLAAIDGVRVAR